jgi:capsular exopolysaccharide synthesis family protein
VPIPTGLQPYRVTTPGPGQPQRDVLPPLTPAPEQEALPRGGAEQELRRHLGVLRRRWLWLAASIVLSLAGAAALTTAMTPQYEARIRLFVAVGQSSDDVGTAYQGGLLSQQRAASYAELVAGHAVAAEVVERLGLVRTPAELQSQITAEAPPNTVLIDVAVVDPRPDLARRIADEAAAVLSRSVHQLEAPTTGTASPIRVRVAEPAHVAPVPVSPDPVLNLGFAATIGLLIGVSAAFLREALDTRVSDPDELPAILGAPSLGLVHHDRDARKRPLILDDDPYTVRSESFRQLRTHLQFVDVDSPPRSLLVTSARAEEGKSTTTCNLAISLAQSGLRVCLVEADLRRPGASRYLGVESGAGLTNVLVGTAALDDVLQPWQGGLLDVLAAGPIPPNPSELLAADAMRRLLRELEGRYDLVLVDSAPVLPVTDSVILSTATSGAVLVVRAGRTARHEVRRAGAQLRSVGSRLYGTVLVDVPSRKARSQGYGYEYRPARGRRGSRRS